MKILGINHSNDAAAALVVDGRVIAASQEERFSRVKHDASFPDKAIDSCLKFGGLTLADLDAIGFFWNPGIHAEAPPRRLTSSVRHHLEYLLVEFYTAICQCLTDFQSKKMREVRISIREIDNA